MHPSPKPGPTGRSIPHLLARLLLAACTCQAWPALAAPLAVGAPLTTAPAALVDPLGTLTLDASRFLVPIEARGADGLDAWQFSLVFDGSIAAPADGGGLFLSVYQADFGGGQWSQIASSGWVTDGTLSDVSGWFSPAVSGDGPLAYVLFAFQPGREGDEPGVRLADDPGQSVPEPGSLALALAAGGALTWQRRRTPWRWAGLLAAGLCCGTGASAQTTAAGSYYALPAWSQKLPASTRFVLLSNWGSEAVMDRETGLLWQRNAYQGTSMYAAAFTYCATLLTGGRAGWRLPSMSELQSLQDVAGVDNGGELFLPPGHPFLNVSTGHYWTTTGDPQNGGQTFGVTFSKYSDIIPFAKTTNHPIWCVRGPGGAAGPQ